MDKFLHESRLTLFILLSLFRLHPAGLLYGAEFSGLEFAPGENQQRQNQEVDQKAFKIKVNVALVTTDVTVTGTTVPELRQEDFTIQDNGVAQTLSHFSRGQFPLAVAILIDRSTSIEPYLPTLKKSALSMLGHLRPEDQVALFSFSWTPVILRGLTTDRITVVNEIKKITTGVGRGTTNIYESIHDVAAYLAENAPNRRRAVILVSDNCHNAGYDAEGARVALLKASATLYGIETSGVDSCFESSKQVQWIASDTGGEILYVNTPASLQAGLEKAISSLRRQYTLGFAPSDPGPDGSFHKLSVSITAQDRCPACRVQARSGYYAGISAPFLSRKDDSVVPQNSQGSVDFKMVQSIMLSAGTTPGPDLTDVPFTVKSSKQTDPKGQSQLKLDIRIHISGTSFGENASRTCKFYVGVLYGDAEWNILGSDLKTIQGSLSEQSYDQVVKEGILVSATIPIKTKKQIIKVVVYDEANDSLGTKLVKVH
jgi:Ca-activated chloride channel homolog